jgi:enoyl-CoA hydratase/carnithine racemase
MLEALEAALDSIEADEAIRVVVLTGAGDRAFCAGADVEAWSALAPIDMWRTWVRAGHRAMDRLEGLRQPTIAALNGIAYGGGLELALACDLRIAADTARVAAPEGGHRHDPAWGMTTRLAVVAGPARAKQMILTGEPVDARRAEAWGVLSRSCRRRARGRGPPHGRAHRCNGPRRGADREAAHRRRAAARVGIARGAGQRPGGVHGRCERRPGQLPRAPAAQVQGVVMGTRSACDIGAATVRSLDDRPSSIFGAFPEAR